MSARGIVPIPKNMSTARALKYRLTAETLRVGIPGHACDASFEHKEVLVGSGLQQVLALLKQAGDNGLTVQMIDEAFRDRSWFRDKTGPKIARTIVLFDFVCENLSQILDVLARANAIESF